MRPGEGLVFFLHYLLAWANAPYTVAAGVAALFTVLHATGLLGLIAGGGEQDADADHDVDHDVDADADHDVDADADADADHDADADADHDADANHHAVAPRAPSLPSVLLGTLGVGRLPFSVIWQVWSVVFAVAGLSLNTPWFHADGAVPLRTLLWTLPASALIASVAVSVMARVFGPLFSSKEHEATKRSGLVGLDGVVISSSITSEFGEIRVRDRSGHTVRLICKLAPGEAPIPEHEGVLIVAHERGELLVVPLDPPEKTH